MSLRTMLRHRVSVLRLQEVNVNGYSAHQYVLVEKNVPVFIDLNFVRKGKDPMWTPEAGRSASRTGVMFAMPDANILSGDRVVVTYGPTGAFQIEGAVDEAWKPETKHHLELSVKEVSDAIQPGEDH